MRAVTSDDIAVLANPSAGRGRRRALLPAVLAALRESGRGVRVLEASSGEEAEKACRRAVGEGVAALVAVGGDGTVHQGLQAVAEQPVGFGVVPAGTGNDFAACTGVPPEPVAAATAISDALREGRHVALDLARAVGTDGEVRWFGAVLAAGFDAIVNERANRMRWPRGPRRYDVAILLEMARVRPRIYGLELDGADRSFEGTLVAVGNCASYGGGMRIVPDADPADGLLDVIVAAPLGRAALARLKPRLRRGTHVTDPRVTTYRARQVRLHADGIIGYADGERIGPLPLEVTCVPGAVRLLR
ncbi:diacylglycerol kinase family protein [Actinoplanes sp. NPDC051343]|uniref:diacylglycerol kinase family protein n=1 Tax=Actinoplanes sp. NPDC051343 TaxID=3363906 RepID=UPI00378A45D7